MITDFKQNTKTMSFIPKILATATKENDHTYVRRIYLGMQISALEKQLRAFRKDRHIVDSLFEDIANDTFISTMETLIKGYKKELSEYFDKQDEYNS